MFGRPQWFVDHKVGWGLRPVTWQGWVYTAVWAAVLCSPFVLLVTRDKWTEAFIWEVAMGAAMIWDVYQIKQARKVAAMPPKKDPVLYIGDDANSLSTKNLDLEVRR
jgi:hypothetical protein